MRRRTSRHAGKSDATSGRSRIRRPKSVLNSIASASAASSSVTLRGRAVWPMHPIRHTVPANAPEPAADLDAVAGQQLLAHGEVVDAVGDPHRRQLRQAGALGSDERHAHRLQPVLQLPAARRVAGDGRVEALGEHRTEPGVQRLDHRDRRGVVVHPGDPPEAAPAY